MTAWLNGQPVATEFAASRGLHYGDGVFRTLLMQQGQPVDWLRQYARLQEDARRLDLQIPDATVLEAQLRLGATADGFAVAKIMLTRRGQGRGYTPAGSLSDCWILHSALPPYAASYWTGGVAVERSRVTLGAQPLLAGIKHLNRLEQVLASRDWPAGVQERLLCDAQGAPVCGTRTNLFWVRAGQLFTPPLRDSGVCGMMRQKIREQAMVLDIQCREETCSWPELLAADEIFLSNSLIGLWPVRMLDALTLPVPGPVTHQLSGALRHPWQGVA